MIEIFDTRLLFPPHNEKEKNKKSRSYVHKTNRRTEKTVQKTLPSMVDVHTNNCKYIRLITHDTWTTYKIVSCSFSLRSYLKCPRNEILYKSHLYYSDTVTYMNFCVIIIVLTFNWKTTNEIILKNDSAYLLILFHMIATNHIKKLNLKFSKQVTQTHLSQESNQLE